jgi:hypothetical protein
MRCEIVIGKEKANRKKLDTKIKKDLTRILRRIRQKKIQSYKAFL